MVWFANIEDCYFADWTHPDAGMRGTHDDLKRWGDVCQQLRAWIYPNPYGTGAFMPVGNIDRNVNLIRSMYDAGVRGAHLDLAGSLDRSGISELQRYLLFKLLQNVNCDVDAVVKEFTDAQYGPAAPSARKYLAELEEERRNMNPLPPRVTYASRLFDERTFPYLTAENIHRWQKSFDEMEKLVEDRPEQSLNVRLLRRELDLATLWKWFDLKKAYPDDYTDHEALVKRISSANAAAESAEVKARPFGVSAMRDFANIIRGGGKRKPLPPEFDGIAQSRIRQYVPQNVFVRSKKRTVLDPAAAFGYAATTFKPELPFVFGADSKRGNSKDRVQRALTLNDVKPGVYHPYKLGEINVTPNTRIWMPEWSCSTQLELGPRVYEPGTDNRWEAWASLKFEGEMYGGEEKEPSVLCDRIILVKKE